MRVLLTGASGFLGRRIGIELARQGHEVVALVHKSGELPFPAESRSWQQPGPLRDIDAIIHLAGESIGSGRWSRARKERILSSRTETTAQLKKIVEDVKGRKPQVLISASAVGFYGDRGEEWLNEGSARGEGFLADVCVAWENAARQLEAVVPRVVILRTGIVLGREGGALAEMLPLFKRGLGGKLGSGRQWMSWIHVEDMVQLYLFALKNPLAGVFNAVAPEPVTNSEFTRALASALKVKAWLPAPAFALRAALGEMSDLLLQGQRVKEQLRERGFAFRYEKIADAFTSLFKEVERARGLRFHEHTSEQWLALPPEEVFAFFSDAKNLERITPPEKNLHILSQSNTRLQARASYTYSLRWNGWRFLCRSHVIDWQEGKRFTSTQQKGPFTFWYHTHQFERLGGGTLLTDRVIYRLRGGYLGDLVGGGPMRRTLGRIFGYRRERTKQLLGMMIPLRQAR